MVTCVICKNSFKNNQSLIKHVAQTHSCNTVQYKFYFTKEFSKCGVCEKDLTFEFVTKSFRPGKKKIFCSDVCSKAAKNRNVSFFKLKFGMSDEMAEKEFLKVYKRRNLIGPNRIKYWLNKGYSEEESKELVSSHNKNIAGISLFNFKQRYGDEIGHKKYVEFCLNRSKKYSGEGNPRFGVILDESLKNLISEKVLEFQETEIGRNKIFEKYLKSDLNVNSSELEFVVKKELESLGIMCTGQYPLLVDKDFSVKDLCINKIVYLYDLKIIGYNVLIEVYGSYIHANPKLYNENSILSYKGGSFRASDRWKKDRYKEDYAKLKGFNLFIYWDTDDLKSFCFELKSFLENL